ncbi:MAG: VWA domain-containing protein [Gammaproteobacteria bacterium]|nr:VWA domain-containing protein [Gammaproteobacteria bacterium]
MIHDFHFLRPLCFLALVPIAVLLALWWRKGRSDRGWAGVVDAALLPHLLIGRAAARSLWMLTVLAMTAVLAVTALAGPTWSKLKQPVFRRDSALVVLLDLSRSMDAADLKPSRLQMARFKLRDLLAKRKEGDTALVVYAAEPFAVTPLTNDTATIERQLSSLTPDLMPAQGSRADLALAKAETLMQDAGAVRGDVLLITDGVENTSSAALGAAIRKLVSGGYRLSVLGVGTPDGAPIPLQDGGFLTDSAGAIVIPKLDEAALGRLAADGQGIYRRLDVGDRDVEAFAQAFDRNWRAEVARKTVGLQSDQWREAGPWLLLPLLPIAALAFRRGALLAVGALLLLPLPRPAHAVEWQGFWQRPDQRASSAFAEHHPTEAARLFKDPAWRAAAHYRAGDYAAAVKDLEGRHNAEADYNRGNALAHLGKYSEAIQAYDSALKQDPGLQDAVHNRDLVKQWLQQQEAESQKRQSQQDQQNQKQQDAAKQNGASAKKKQGQEQSSGGALQGHNDRGRNSRSQGERGGNAKEGQEPEVSDKKGTDESHGSDAAQQGGTQKDKPLSEKSGAKDGTQNVDQDRRQATSDARDGSASATDAEQAQNESEQATAQWLRRILDDPGGLWRRKFLYQYQREHPSRQGEEKPW